MPIVPFAAGGAHRTLIRGRAFVVAVCTLSVVGCDSLLDVDLPNTITDEDLADAANAELQVNSAISLFECGYSAFAWVAMGYEDALEPRHVLTGGVHAFPPTPLTGECDTAQPSANWFDQIMGARAMISNARGAALTTTSKTNGARSKHRSGCPRRRPSTWRPRSIISGEFFCETALDGGDLLSPDAVLAMAEAWITDRALAHIATGGDFGLPNGIATSAETMARGLRARIRWARGDLAGASADAEVVPQGFTAWVTREAGATRRNKIHVSVMSGAGFSYLPYPNALWNPAMRRPNPATGLPWPDPIPFTGYVFLGILSDGQVVDDIGHPVFWASGRDWMEEPVRLDNGAVADTRVPHRFVSISGPSGKFDVPWRYERAQDDVPLVDWEEMWLIRAELEGGQGAIDRVNELRASAGLPLVTYIDGITATPAQIRTLLLEERRRSFFSEGGRYWSTKIQNSDVLWFPRGEGQTGPFPLQGGVRLAMPDAEYTTNPHFIARGGLAARGTGCDPLEAPVFP